MKSIGKIIRIEYDSDTKQMNLVMEITDEKFKLQALHNIDFKDILSIKGKDVMIVASKSKKEQ